MSAPACPRCDAADPESVSTDLWRCGACGVEFSTPSPGGWVEDGDLVWFASPSFMKPRGKKPNDPG